MGLLQKIFGQSGTIRYSGETNDGREFTGKTRFESVFATNSMLEEHLINEFWVQQGIRVKWLKITGVSLD